MKGRIGRRKGLEGSDWKGLCKGPMQMKTAGVKDDGNGMAVVAQEGDN